MRDLYKRLGIECNATEAEMRVAIAHSDDSSRVDAEYILLDPRRRMVYDRNHKLLSTIGHLRGRLALGLRPFWSHGNHQDFTQPFVPGVKVDPIGVIGAVRRGWEQRRSQKVWAWFIFLLVGVCVCAWWLCR